MSVKHLSENLFVLEDANSLVSFIDDKITQFSAKDDVGQIEKIAIGESSYQYQAWGKENNLPQDREFLVTDNNIVGELISTKRGIILGSKLVAFKNTYQEGKEIKEQVNLPKEVSDWLEETNINMYFRRACKNLLFHSNVFTEIISDKARKKIARIHCKECRHTRKGKMDLTGSVNDFLWSGSWGKTRNKEKVKPKRIPAYDYERLLPKSILHTGDDLLTLDDYYYHPAWWGGKQWILLANCIPEFHLANLKHGYNIRYHIQIPKDYFSDKSATAQTPNERDVILTKEAEAKKVFLDGMNDFLAGIKNSGRAVFTTYDTNLQYVVGSKYPGIEIEPISADLQDEAMLKLFERSNQANISAQGIHPTLAAIETQGKLSSGTEIRNAFGMYVAIKTPTIRRILLEPLKIVQKINGWDPDLQFWFKDIELAKLDEEPTGKKEGINE